MTAALQDIFAGAALQREPTKRVTVIKTMSDTPTFCFSSRTQTLLLTILAMLSIPLALITLVHW